MNRLYKIITLMLLLSFLSAGVALATIEKDKSKKKTKKTTQNVTPGDSTDEAGQMPVEQPVPDSGQKAKRPQGYDDFVDKNSNGIDDRVERKKEGRKKKISSETSQPSLINPGSPDNETTRQQRSPDDSIVKLKNR